MFILRNILSHRLSSAFKRTRQLLGTRMHSSNGESYNFSHEFFPRFAASVAATTFTATVFTFTISEIQAISKRRHDAKSLEQANFKRATVRIDQGLENIISHQTKHIFLLNDIAKECCGVSIGGIFKDQDSFRKHAVKIGRGAINRFNLPCDAAIFEEISAIDEVYASYSAILTEWNRLDVDQKKEYLCGKSDDFEEFAVLSIGPSTLCLIGIVIPIKIGITKVRGVYIPSKQMVDVATLFSTYLSWHVDTMYVPTEEDMNFIINSIQDCIQNDFQNKK